MIQVSVPATIPLKDYDYNAEVELINPVADTVANANGKFYILLRYFFQNLFLICL